jgi:mono/diheme cytochrome c family protein
LVAAVFCCQAMAASAPTDPQVAAGKYLADAAHCDACHTSDPGRPFAGNLAIPSKFGTMFSSNITPDPATGIGKWTEADFDRALRQGRGLHGEYLYPAMPYTDFTKVSDADIHALWVYFRTVRPIVERQKPNRMKFPFDIRTGIAAWQAIYFRKGPYVPDTSQSDEWNRGAYLVKGLGHCGACHTPRNFAMASETDHALQGGDTGNWWFAPDISGSRFSGIHAWSNEQIVAYLQSGHNDLNVAAVGPMLEEVAKGSAHLSKADLQAIAVYLKNQAGEESAQAAPPARSTFALTEAERQAGGGIYLEHCQSCHGADGRGAPGVAAALAGNSALTSANSETAVHAVLQGFAPQGPWGAMPSFIQVLGSQEIADVVNYLRNSWGNVAPTRVDATMVGKMAYAIDTYDPRIEAALICPPVPASALDPAAQASIESMARTQHGDATIPPALLKSYRARHPDEDPAAVATALSTMYCRSLMNEPGGSTTEKQMRFIRFMARASIDSSSKR